MQVHYHSKVWGQLDLKEIHTFIQQGCIKLAESNSKDINNVTKIQYPQIIYKQQFSSLIVKEMFEK